MNIEEAKNVYFAYCNHPHGEMPSREDLGKALGSAMAELKALSSPRPEAREEDIAEVRERIEGAIDDLADMHEGDECKARGGDGCLACMAQDSLSEALAALSRLASTKPEGQEAALEALRWISYAAGMSMTDAEYRKWAKNRADLALHGQSSPMDMDDTNLDAIARALDVLDGRAHGISSIAKCQAAKNALADFRSRLAAPKPEGQEEHCGTCGRRECPARGSTLIMTFKARCLNWEPKPAAPAPETKGEA